MGEWANGRRPEGPEGWPLASRHLPLQTWGRYTPEVGLEKLIESQIQDAMAAGAFDNLDGAGKPLPPPSLADQLAGDNWLGFKMLRNADLVPEWLGLGKEIEDDLAELDRMEGRYRETCIAAMSSSSPATHGETIRRQYAAYEEFARAIRKKQERFNQKAPGPRSQRAPIWVEHHLKRLRSYTPASDSSTLRITDFPSR